MTKAIAYTRDRILSQSGEGIHRNSQIELINRFAAENAIEIIAWFTDDAAEENLLKRPGIQALLAYDAPYDVLICERIWVLSRSMAGLAPFLKELDRRGVRLESATSMWDCVSQQCRRRSKSLPILPHAIEILDAAGESGRYRVAKPVRLNFVHLVHPAPPSISPRL